ncbi:hypothetical protein CK203_028573 [Vitis vinifera]|uniref:Uncharacterized protein n=1 Tax=Vitis vinifera TaxID=29760 RepID=A0A438I2C7_VITVI|nr:hypothetical protein CK203_028573 [Vitis vinifera]
MHWQTNFKRVVKENNGESTPLLLLDIPLLEDDELSNVDVIRNLSSKVKEIPTPLVKIGYLPSYKRKHDKFGS